MDFKEFVIEVNKKLKSTEYPRLYPVAFSSDGTEVAILWGDIELYHSGWDTGYDMFDRVVENIDSVIEELTAIKGTVRNIKAGYVK